MTAHICAECGLLHDAITTEVPESDEVKIARINADRDRDVARYAARQDANWNETRVEVAEIEAEAAVESAVVEGEVIAAALEASDVDAEPIEIIAPSTVTDVDVQVDDEPPPLDGSPVPDAPSKASFGMW